MQPQALLVIATGPHRSIFFYRRTNANSIRHKIPLTSHIEIETRRRELICFNRSIIAKSL